MARKSENRPVQLAYLLFQVTDINDPMLDAARRGEDHTLKTLADTITQTMSARDAAATQPAAIPAAPTPPATTPAATIPAATAPAGQ